MTERERKMQRFSELDLAGLNLRQLWKVALFGKLPRLTLDVNNEQDAYTIKTAKQKIRKRNKNHQYETVFQNYGDSCMFHIVTDCKTVEEAKNMFSLKYETHFIPSPYDCTGSIETSLHVAWKRPIDGKICIYYGKSMDV